MSEYIDRNGSTRWMSFSTIFSGHRRDPLEVPLWPPRRFSRTFSRTLYALECSSVAPSTAHALAAPLALQFSHSAPNCSFLRSALSHSTVRHWRRRYLSRKWHPQFLHPIQNCTLAVPQKAAASKTENSDVFDDLSDVLSVRRL